MTHGKSIRIYLADGTALGIRHGEIVNWTGQAIACPRTRVAELKNWEEAKRPGVYFLFGIDADTGRDAAYIGEAENVNERLTSHLAGKDFWNDVVLLTSKDANLTKAHVKYLESRLIAMATEARRYKIENAALPQLPVLPRSDVAAMEEFLESARTLLGVFGHKILDSLTHIQSGKAADGKASKDAEGAEQDVAGLGGIHEIFYLRVKDIEAQAARTDEGIVVLAGSTASLNALSSLSNGYLALREKLLASEVMVKSNGKLLFATDYLFSSPSQAAAVIVGYAINGRDAWRTINQETLAEIEHYLAGKAAQ